MKNKEELKNYIILVLIGVFSYWALNHIQIFINIIKTIIKVLKPFILGATIAFILNIPTTKIEKYINKKFKLNKNNTRIISIILSIFIFITILLFVALLLIPELIENIKNLINIIPALIAKVEMFTINLLEQYPDIQVQIQDVFEGTGNIANIISNLLNYLINSSVDFIKNLISSFILVFTSIMFSVYMLIQKETLLNGIKKVIQALFGKEKTNKVIEIAKVSNVTFNKFVTGQCLESCILGAIMFVVLAIFKFPYALLISVLTAITALIPVFGAWIAMGVGAVLILVTKPMQVFMFIIVFLIIQQIENNFIYPKVVGGSVGLSPMWSLLAITVGGNLFGVVGMLIGLPLASILYSALKNTINDKLKKIE